MKAREWAEAHRKREEFRGALVKLMHRMHPSPTHDLEAERLYNSIGSTFELDALQRTFPHKSTIDLELGYKPSKADLGDLRYKFYTHNGIDAVNIAPMDQGWLDNMWRLIPRTLKINFYTIAEGLCDEVCDEYRSGVKSAMIEFVLHEPDLKVEASCDSGPRHDPDLRVVPKIWNLPYQRAGRRLLRELHAFNQCLGYIHSVWTSVFS